MEFLKGLSLSGEFIAQYSPRLGVSTIWCDYQFSNPDHRCGVDGFIIAHGVRKSNSPYSQDFFHKPYVVGIRSIVAGVESLIKLCARSEISFTEGGFSAITFDT